MQHYYCQDCHEITPETHMSVWSNVYLDLRTGLDAVEGGPACPCGSACIEEAVECDGCGELFGCSQLDGNELCRVCAEKEEAA